MRKPYIVNITTRYRVLAKDYEEAYLKGLSRYSHERSKFVSHTTEQSTTGNTQHNYYENFQNGAGI